MSTEDGRSRKRRCRPRLNGPVVWELVVFLQEIDERGEAAVAAAAETSRVPPSAVGAGYLTSRGQGMIF